MNKSFACLTLLAALLLAAACHGERENPTLVQPEAQMTAPDQALKLIKDTAPPPVELFNYPDGDSVVLWWRDWNPGDYNVDGTVNGLDLFPLAANFQEAVTRENGLSCVDGNDDDVLNGLDVFTIAVNFQNQLDGYNVYSAPAEEGPFETKLNAEPLTYLGCGERQEYYIAGGSKAPDEYYVVKSVANVNEESIESLPVGRSVLDVLDILPEVDSLFLPEYEFGFNPVSYLGVFVMEWTPGVVQMAEVDYETGQSSWNTIYDLEGGTLLGLSLDFKPDGTVGIMLGVDDKLILKERPPGGEWTEESVWDSPSGFLSQCHFKFDWDTTKVAFGHADGVDDAVLFGVRDGGVWQFEQVPGTEGSAQNPQPRVYIPPYSWDMFKNGVMFFNWQYDDPEEPEPLRRLAFAERTDSGWVEHVVKDFDGPGFPITPNILGSTIYGKLGVNFTDIFADQMYLYTKNVYDSEEWIVHESPEGSGACSDMCLDPLTGKLVTVRNQWEDDELHIVGQAHRDVLFRLKPVSQSAGGLQMDVHPSGRPFYIAYGDKADDQTETPFHIMTFKMTPQF